MENAAIGLPRYRCHKEVHAAKILSVDGGLLALDVRGDGKLDAYVMVDVAFLVKHSPQPGGYFVIYEDGYESFSPAAPFESGYTRLGV